MNGEDWNKKLKEAHNALGALGVVQAAVLIMGEVVDAVYDILNPCSAALAPVYMASLSAVIESIAEQFPGSEKMAKALLSCVERISYSQEEIEKQIRDMFGGSDEDEK